MKRRHIVLLGVCVFVLLSSITFAEPPEVIKLTRENWCDQVGFKPDLSVGDYKPGDVIDKNNLDKVSELVPEGIRILIKKYNLKLWIRPYEPIVPSDGYIEATNKYRGKHHIIDTGDKAREIGIFDYEAGLPFPNPKTGLEIAWNKTYEPIGDDGDNLFRVYWISAKRGVERWEEWRWLYINHCMHRTDIDPRPHIERMAKKEIQYKSMTITLAPFDKKGFIAMYSRYEDPKDMEGWIYIPAQRRAIRFSFGSRGDAWNNTDLLYEDVRGYMGYPEWMHWKIIGKKTLLAPMHAGIAIGKENIEKTYNFKDWPHWNPKMDWEPRPVYVVEVIPKFPDYPYSKMTFYIDAETYYMVYKEAYDRKGQLWKVLINASNTSPDPRTLPLDIGTCLVVDLQSEHATAFPWFESKINVGLEPELFSLTSIRKLGR